MKHLYESVFSGALLTLLVASPPLALAQSMPQAPTPAEAQAALNPAPAPFTNAQIDQMVAPVALYPDQLLTQVLMAATFPDQLVDAQKWLQDSNNASLKGDDLANALQPLSWDPSVKSLVAFPQLIAMMTNHLDWTQALGQAFATQEVQVFARVQFLRDRAKQAGFLKSNSQIAVSEQDSDIIIAPANPDMLYVPVYNPADVYGPWPDNDYPPVFLPPPPGFYSGAIGAGIGFSVGLGIVRPLWGWGHPNWRNHSVAIDPGTYQHIAGPNFAGRGQVSVEGGTWRHAGPVALVPEAQRPRPTQPAGEMPKGTVQPSAVFHPGARPAGEPGRPNEVAPGPRPAGETARPEENRPGGPPRPGEAQPGPRPAGEPGRPNEAAPGPRPAGETARPEENRPGGPPRPGEAQPGPRPAGETARPEENRPGGPPRPGEVQPGPRPAGEAQPGARPEERAAPPPQAPRPAGPPPQVLRPEEHAAPPQAPRPAGPPPQVLRPEEHAAPPQAPRPAGPPPQAPRPAGPPPQAPHPAGPAPQAHPAPPQKAPPKPGEEHNEPQH